MLAPQRVQRKDNLLQEQQARRAVIALLKHVEKERAGSAALFADADTFSLIISLKRMSGDKKTKPKRIPIPHPYLQLDGKEVCLFVKDHEGEGHKTAKQKIKDTVDSGVAKVVGVSKLKSNYKAPESRRRLCNSFDLFCADDRILPLLPKLIGKTFFKKKKQPVPVDLTSKDWAAEIRKATSATYLFMNGGTSLNVKVGTTDQSEDEITANLLAAAAGVAAIVPRGWDNVLSMYLKTTASVALPIYTAALTLPAKIPAALGAGAAGSDGEEDEEDGGKPAAKAAKRGKGDTPGKAAGGGAPKAASARNRPLLMQEQAEAAAGAGASAKGAAAKAGAKAAPAASGGAAGKKGAGAAKAPAGGAAAAAGASVPGAAAAAKKAKQAAAAASPAAGAGGKAAGGGAKKRKAM